jgi:hypothetical protein
MILGLLNVNFDCQCEIPGASSDLSRNNNQGSGFLYIYDLRMNFYERRYALDEPHGQ